MMACFWGGQVERWSCRLLIKVAALVLIVHARTALLVHTNNKTASEPYFFPITEDHSIILESGGHPGLLESGGHPGYLESGGHPGLLESGGHPGLLESGGHPGLLESAVHESYAPYDSVNETHIGGLRIPRKLRLPNKPRRRSWQDLIPASRRSNIIHHPLVGGTSPSIIRNPVSDLADALVNGLSNALSTSTMQDSNNLPQERIFRGAEARPHVWPWMAKVKTFFTARNERKRTCGGALISDMFILTARHCVSWKNTGEVVAPRQVKVWLGSHGVQGMDGLEADIELIISRDDYEAPTCANGVWCPSWAFWSHTTLTNDIVLLQLKRPVPLSRKIQPIKINLGHTVPNTPAWVGGWGLDGRSPSSTLQLTQVKIMEDDYRECRSQMSPSKICVVGEDRSGPCQGDSGSPLVVYEESGPSLVGLVSNGAMKCTKGLPGIFTRVSHYVDWIDANVKVSLINAQTREQEKKRLKEQNRFNPKVGNPFQEQFWPNVFTPTGTGENNINLNLIKNSFSASIDDPNYGSFSNVVNGNRYPIFRRRRPKQPAPPERPRRAQQLAGVASQQVQIYPFSNRLGHLNRHNGIINSSGSNSENIDLISGGIRSTLNTFSDLLGRRRHRRRFRGKNRRI